MFSRNKKGAYKMCMYVKKDCLKVSNEVQRDINIEDILLNHTAFYDDEKVALKDGYVPLSFATSVRTVYTNRVVQVSKPTPKIYRHKIHQYYVNLGNIEMLPHRGLDLLMYLSSISLFHMVDYMKGFDEVMLHSEFQNIGIFNPNPDFVTPMIYSHVYIDDNFEEEFGKYFKPTCKWVDIDYAINNKNNNITALIDTLIIVDKKEDSSDE